MVLVFTNLQVYWLNHKKKSLIEIYQFTEKNSEWMIRTETKNIDYSFESPASWQQEQDRNALSIITYTVQVLLLTFWLLFLKLGNVVNPTSFFFVKTTLSILGPLLFPTNAGISLLIFAKSLLGFW